LWQMPTGAPGVALVTAQRDRVVASYTVLASTGALSPQVLGLKIEVYDPVTHYQQVRDAWGSARPTGVSRSFGLLRPSFCLRPRTPVGGDRATAPLQFFWTTSA